MKILNIKYLLLLLLFFDQTLYGKEKDSVVVKYSSLRDNTEKLDYLYKLSIHPIYKSNIENKIFLRAETSNIKPANEEEQATINLIKGYTIYFEDSVSKIKQYFLTAYQVLKKTPGSKYYAFSLDALGTLYFELGNKDSTHYYRKTALQNALLNKTGVAEAYFKLGDQYYHFSNLSDAIINLKKCIEVGTQTKDYENTALAFKFLSLIYRDQKTFDYMALCDSSTSYAYKTKDNVVITEALYYKMQCFILLNKQKDALDLLNLIEDYHKREPLNVLVEINFNKAAGFYYSETKDVKKTISYLHKNYTLTGSISRKSGRTGRGYNNLGNVCLEDKQYALAIKYLDTAIYFGQKYNDQTLLWFAYDNIVHAYHELGDYKKEALYFRKLWDINDTILKIENQSKIAEFQTTLDVERKNTSIKNLNSEKALDQATISNYKKTQIIYFIIGLMMLAILITTILFFRQKNKNQKLLAQQSAEIASLQAQMNPHFLFNALTSLQSFVLKDDKLKAVSSISQLAKLMRATLLNSEQQLISIDQEIAYLKMYIDFENQRNGEDINFIIDIEDVIETDSLCIPPMLIQPLLENAIKHAFVNSMTEKIIKITFRLTKAKNEGLLRILVADNGVGFETKENVAHQSKALSICEKRIKNLYINRKVDPANKFSVKNLNSDSQTGTQITLTIPYI